MRTAIAMHLLIAIALCGAIAASERPAPAAPATRPVAMAGMRIEFPPFYIECDVGASKAETKKYVERFQRPIVETANFFLQVYGLKNTCFDDYARFYDDPRQGSGFEKLIRIRLWKRYEDFKDDFQHRYRTRTVPGAFFGITKLQDDYGKDTGVWIRELATATEGEADQQILRHLYHEMGHLFMRTFIVRQVEVPSWIEEGTAELFQLRKGNGTKPEADRDQRQGWLVEMVGEGASIPWSEFTRVQNLDNLDFTWKDPLRATIQYAQAWSVLEFMISTPARQEAFTRLLRQFKTAAEQACDQASAAGLRDKAFLERVRPALYDVQDRLFYACYGAELVAVERNWKDWIRKSYDGDVQKKPILRYHRGEWWVGLRARYARTAAEKAAALAKAEAIFHECVQATPLLPEGHVGLGRVAMERGDLAAASARFGRALELGSENFDALLYGGIARMRNGDAAAAIPALTRAAAQRPTQFDANFYLGQALAMSDGDLATCLTHLSRARDMDKQQTALCALLEGAAQYRHGATRQAYLSWLRAANADATNPIAPLFMALAQAEGDRDDALAILARAKAQGIAGAARLAALIAADKPLPTVVFTDAGWPTLDFAGKAGAQIPAGSGQAAAGERADAGFQGFGD